MNKRKHIVLSLRYNRKSLFVTKSELFQWEHRFNLEEVYIMVNIGIAGVPKMFPGQKQIITNGSNIETGVKPYIMTDVVGQGYPDATGTYVCPICLPILPPPGSAPGAVIMVNPPPNPFQGILPRHNTPDNPAELGGKVAMRLVKGVYSPIVQYTPPQVEP
jgi:hypothetical protein